MSLACSLAVPDDYPAIEALLRAPMGSGWGLAWDLGRGLEAACAAMADRWQAVIARIDGRPLGCGFRFVREVLVDGKRERLGYLAWLRSDASMRGMGLITLLKESMRLLRSQRRNDELPWDITSIVADNHTARRLLERGLPGMPDYRPLAIYESLVVDARRASGPDEQVMLLPGDDARCTAMVHHQLSGYGLAPITAMPHYLALMNADRVRACIGLRDDRPLRAMLVTDLPTGLRLTRPAINLVRRVRGLPRVPATGSRIQALHLGTPACDRPQDLHRLLAAARRHARRMGADSLLAGACLGSSIHRTWAGVQRAHRSQAQWYVVGEGPNPRPAHLEVHQL